MTEKQKIENVIILAGPGGTVFDKNSVSEAVTNFKNAGAKVTLVGDGERSVTSEEIKNAISQLNGSATIFVMAHGEDKNGLHYIDLDGNFGYPTEQLVKDVNQFRNENRVDYFMTSCHGGAARDEVQRLLPEGSAFVDLSPASQIVSGFDIDRFVNTLSLNSYKNGFGAKELLYDYLMTDLQNRIPPALTQASNTSDLSSQFIGRLGQKFTDEERARAHKELNGFGAEKIDEIISKMENAKSEWSIGASDYGNALAISNAASDRSR